MGSVVLILGGFLAALFLSEFVLKETKLQTGLAKVVMVHAGVAALLMIYFFVIGERIWPALIIFWSGAFLTWFGVRSHMESSILLRMLFLLRHGSIDKKRLLEEYESHYGETQRLEELYRGALLENGPEGVVVTPKGKFILRIVSFLT